MITHQGKGRLPRDVHAPVDSKKRGLLDQLPMKIRAYGRSLDSSVARVLILLDQDSDDCLELKQRILAMIQQVDPRPVCLVRIACTETEAFYLGDKTAIRKAFPRHRTAKLRNDDPTVLPEEGDWETFAEIINDPGENKVLWAEKMSQSLDGSIPLPHRNQSPSFLHFCLAIRRLVGER